MPVGGIIPARAGFTPLDLPSRQEYLDHPRSRGVYALMLPGSWSPHWIIPARAGFTAVGEQGDLLGRDHPRSRGVYCPTRCRAPCTSGSSPLARGLRRRRLDDDPHTGIIPARAGFTEQCVDAVDAIRDHPRSRGVYTPASTVPAIVGGSSPLARGLRRRRRTGHDQVRIIPARAGFTAIG